MTTSTGRQTRWTKNGPDYRWGRYRIHAQGDVWHVDMPVNGGMFDTVAEAKRWCTDHSTKRASDEHTRKLVADAPELSAEQARKIASLFDAEGSRARKRAERQPHPASAPPPPGLKRRQLGKPARSNDEALMAYRQQWDEGLARTPMFSMWHASPEDIFRWQIQFDCGCTEERSTTTDDPQSLLDGSDENYFTGQKLPPGEYLCHRALDHKEEREYPLRDIASWDECIGQRELLADPIDPPDWWLGDDDETGLNWARHRHAEPCDVMDWKATLTCGHQIQVDRAVDWTPDQPLRRATPERLAEMRAEITDLYAPEPIPSREAKMLDAGWPELSTYLDCDACKVMCKPAAFEPLGWLVPPPPTPRKPRKQKSPEERLRARLRQAEREAARLRAELKQLKDEEGAG